MKVKTIIDKDFDDLCFNLANEIISDGYEPDVVIGIKNGGAIVTKKVFEYLSIVNKPKYYELTIQHDCTKTCEKIHIKNILKFFPIFILNFIRVTQLTFYEFLYNKFNYIRKYSVEQNLDKDLQFYLSQGGKKILIIDDAIDSGYTMNNATKYIDWLSIPMPGCNQNIIKIAVATTTYKNPIIRPNYSLYNRTIIRFPWAFDNKNK